MIDTTTKTVKSCMPKYETKISIHTLQDTSSKHIHKKGLHDEVN